MAAVIAVKHTQMMSHRFGQWAREFRGAHVHVRALPRHACASVRGGTGVQHSGRGYHLLGLIKRKKL